MRFAATVDGAAHVIEVSGRAGCFRVVIGDRVWEVDAHLSSQGIVSLLVDGASWVAEVQEEDGLFVVDVRGETYRVAVEEETRHLIRTRGGDAAGPAGDVVKAPMPGKVTQVVVAAGDRVAVGDPLLVIEAMKMENELRARTAGLVREVRVAAGQAVNPGDVLLVLEGPDKGAA
jgi:biotin carboxyl carrier protein